MAPVRFLLVILAAVTLDLLLGDPPNRWHPVAWLGWLITTLTKYAPSERRSRSAYGVALVVLGSGLVAGLTIVLERLMPVDRFAGLLLHALILKLSFSISGLRKAGRRIGQALSSDQLNKARRWLSRDLVSRPTANLTSDQVAAAAIESLTENLTDSLVAPLLAYALGGLPAAWVYRFINTADAMVGYRTPPFEYLGKAGARLDDCLNWIPARLTAGLILLAAPISQGSIKGGWLALLTDRNTTESPNAGWTMAAAGGVLGVCLEKMDQYSLNRAGRPPTPADLIRADRLLVAVTGFALVVVALVGGLLLAL